MKIKKKNTFSNLKSNRLNKENLLLALEEMKKRKDGKKLSFIPTHIVIQDKD